MATSRVVDSVEGHFWPAGHRLGTPGLSEAMNIIYISTNEVQCRSFQRFMVTCPGVHLSGGSLVRGFWWFSCLGFSCPEVHLSGGSLVRTSRLI